VTELSPVQEKFAREFVQGGTAADAYRKANPKARKWKAEAVHVEAHRTKEDPKVRLRIEELQAAAREKHNITIERLTEMLQEDRALAHKVDAPSAAVSAVMGIAKLHGLVVDKTKNEHTGSDGKPLVPVLNVTVGRNQS